MNFHGESKSTECIGSRASGRATVLVVENHGCLREVARVILERCGYRVLTAANGRIAKRVLLDEAGIDLVLTDLEMQEMSGQQLALWCNANRPGVRVVLMSDAPGVPIAPGFCAVEMPFIHIDVLIKTVREALNSSGASRRLERAA